MSLTVLNGENKRENKLRRHRVLDGRLTKIIKLFLIQRDGPNCHTCGKPDNAIQGRLQINHIDLNPENNNPVNLNLMHARCNRQHFLSQLKIREKEKTIEPQTKPSSWEASRSLELRPTLELECRRLLEESGSKDADWIPTVKNMQDRLSKILGCDQEVVAKFIDREVQPEGFLTVSERTIVDRRKKRTAQVLSVRRPPE